MSRGKWILTGGLVVALLAAAGVGAWLWQRGGGAVPAFLEQVPGIGQLPLGEEGIAPQAAEAPGTTPTPEPPSVGAQASLPEATTSLAVRLAYQTQPSFQISIARVARTFEVPTVERHTPRANQPFSIVKVLGASGAVLSEHRITVLTTVGLETFDEAGDIVHEGVTPLRGELDVVVPITAVPARIQVTTADGQVMSEQAFTYDELPVDEAERREPISGWQKSLAWLQLLPALAQVPGGGGPFVIAVTDQQAPQMGTITLQAVHEMVGEIEPWKTFNDQGLIRVVQVIGGDLGCRPVPVVGGNRQLPGCPNSGKVYRWVHKHGVRPNAIVVGVNVNCGSPRCGATYLGTGISGVGGQVNGRLVAHELGHAVGRAQLQDEYLYRFQVQGAAQLPNCFPDQPVCESAIVRFSGTDASCHVGCNTVTAIRPSLNHLMHSLRVSAYGPLQTCVMSEAIAQEIGVPEPGLCRGATQDPEHIFWGWFKGG